MVLLINSVPADGLGRLASPGARISAGAAMTKKNELLVRAIFASSLELS